MRAGKATANLRTLAKIILGVAIGSLCECFYVLTLVKIFKKSIYIFIFRQQ